MRVFCDLDGVVADFATPATEALGIDFSKGFVVIDVSDWRKLQKQWPTFWVDLEPLPYAQELWRAIQPWHPSILTAAPDVWRSSSIGKEVWVKRYLPKFGYHPEQKFYCVRREEKQNFATTHGEPNILIDDMSKNIREWEQAGGIGIQYKPSRSAIQTVVATIQGVTQSV